MALGLAALLLCAACETDDEPTGGGDPDVSTRLDGAVDGAPGMDAGPPDGAPPDRGPDAAPPDQGVDAGPPDRGLAPPPRRPGRLQWTGGPQGRGLPSFDYTGAGVRLRGSLTP